MTNRTCAIVIISMIYSLAGSRLAGSQAFTDPAPPTIHKLGEMPLGAPKTYEGLKFHAAPKPLAVGATTSDWRLFQGPFHNGVSIESPLLKTFGKLGPTKIWEAPKGEGFATAAVVGDRVILFHRVGANDIIDCLQAETGKRFWKLTYPNAYSDRYGFNGGPRCQPLSDGQNIYTMGVGGDIHCIKLTTGQIIWNRNIVKDFKLKQNFFGVGSTPLLEGELLIINVGASGGPCVAGFNKLTGKLVWGAGKAWGPSYASPVAATVHGKRRIFAFAGGESRPATGGLLCIDPANGKVDFSFPWRGTRYESVNASAPLVIGNRVFISECYGKGGAMLDIGPEFTFKEVWSNTSLGTHFMTAIHKDGYLYGADGHGPRNAPLVCVDANTGKEMWRTEPEWSETAKTSEGERKLQLMPALCSLTMVDGRCLLAGEYGHLAWIDLNPKGYKEIERTSLFLAPETWGMPAISRGLLYICQNNKGIDGSEPRLICYDLRGEKRP